MSQEQQLPVVGIVGVGLMGHGIASNIVKKGWKLNYFNHAGNQPTADLDALGAQGFDALSALAAASDVVILCLTGSAQVEGVLKSEGGILSALRPGTVIVDCSTAVPASTIALAPVVEAAGGRFMDAAMTRTPVEAAAGRLNLLIGADDDLYAQMEPLLAAFSENRFHAGAVGAGHTLKLLHNFVSLGSVALISEAARCSASAGIKPEVLVDVLQKGGGFGAALDRVSPYLLAGDMSKLKFSISNAQKDLTYYTQLASDQGVARSVAGGVHQALTQLTDAGLGDRFLPELVDLLVDPK